MSKKLQIRNSTAEFLIFQIENQEDGIEVMYRDETLWLTQDAIALLFDKGRSTITEHLQNILQKFLITTAGVVFHYCRLVVSKEIQKVSKALEHSLFLLVY